MRKKRCLTQNAWYEVRTAINNREPLFSRQEAVAIFCRKSAMVLWFGESFPKNRMTSTFRFQPPRGTDPVHVSVYIELQQVFRIVSGPSGSPRLRTRKARAAQIKVVDIRFYNLYGIIVPGVVFYTIQQ
jgi:hypothetical protein